MINSFNISCCDSCKTSPPLWLIFGRYMKILSPWPSWHRCDRWLSPKMDKLNQLLVAATSEHISSFQHVALCSCDCSHMIVVDQYVLSNRLHMCVYYSWYLYIYIYIYEPRKLFGTKRNWRGVPTSFSSPVTFWGVWPRSPMLHLFLIAKCFTFDAYLVLGVFLPRFTA